MSEERKTVDGVPVKLNDRVWRVTWHGVRQVKLDKWDLGLHWDAITRKEIYSTERAALQGRIDRARHDRKKARRVAKNAEKMIARMNARLATLESP